MNTSTLLIAILGALGAAGSASASTSIEQRFAADASPSLSAEMLAKNGADDPIGGEDLGCDDNGTDVCALLAKNGADDLDGEDDNGVDFVAG